MKFITIFASVLFVVFSLNARASGMIDIHPGFGATNSVGYSATNGSIIVGMTTTSGASNARAFKYENGVSTDLGVLASGDNSFATGVSLDGSIIVGYGNLTSMGSTYHAFKYSGGTMTDLGTLGGTNSFAYQISGDGSTTVGQSTDNSSSSIAFSHTDGGGMISLGTLGGNASAAYGVSYDGSIITGYSRLAGNSISRAFIYSGGVMTDLGTLGGTDSFGSAISNDGTVIVGNSEITGDLATHAFKYDVGGSMVSIGTLGGTDSEAYSVSSNGSIIVGRSEITVGSSIVHAFKYTDSGGMVDLGTLGGTNSEAYAISPDGTVITGYSETSSGDSHAFIYNNAVDNASMVDVNNTYAALYHNGHGLNSLFNLRNALVRSNLDQECTTFGKNGVCVGVGYRFSNVNHQYVQQQAANLKVAYRVTPNFKIGLMLDQTLDSHDPNNFTVQNSQPMVGVYSTLTQREDGSGFGAKVAALYSSNDTTIKRSVLENTEAGIGSSHIKTSGLLAEVFYGSKVAENLMLKPFVGIRQTLVSRAGYSETQGASFPITYDPVKQKLTTAIFGFKSLYNLSKETALSFSAGLESNLKNKMNGYSGNIATLGSFTLNAPNIRSNTAFVNAGIYHDLKSNQRISADIYYGGQALQTSNSAMIYLGYSFGF